VRVRIRAADDGCGDVVLRDELGDLLEVPRQCELLSELAGCGGVRPPLERVFLAVASSSAQHTVSCPMRGLPPPPAASNSERSSSSGAVPIRPSPAVAASFAAFDFPAATMIGGGSSGSV
jgi:hypothetical protein